MAAKKMKSPFRLTFGGTRATKSADSLEEALSDAQYWIKFGQMKVCVQERLPSGRFETVTCVRRNK